jgi:polysaccharide pyruvyl transferase WcaK-like protein
MTDSAKTLKLALLGAAPDTGNLGVSALSLSVISGIARRAPDAQLTVFDHGRGIRSDSITVEGKPFGFARCGLRNSRRMYMPESLRNVQFSALMGITGNPAARVFLESDAVLDITGGDSFTDLYGLRRFRGGAIEKRLALRHSAGLILLPQTYGPYNSPEAKRVAADLLVKASLVIARDEESYSRLHDLLGDRLDQRKHILGVDVAFALPAAKPPEAMLDDGLRAAIERSPGVFGFNVSGLCYNDPASAAERFGFRADYRAAVHETLSTILGESRQSVMLMPHVVVPDGNVESDVEACRAVAERLSRFRERLFVAPSMSDPRHAKWLISRCEWFCGTRMHATIAGLSSGVPTASIAYSLKTRGVFATCDSADAVADPRSSATDEVVSTIVHAWRSREDHRVRLRLALPRTLARAESQMDEVLTAVQRLRRADRTPAA